MNRVANDGKTAWIHKVHVSKDDSYTEHFTILQSNEEAHRLEEEQKKVNQSQGFYLKAAGSTRHHFNPSDFLIPTGKRILICVIY